GVHAFDLFPAIEDLQNTVKFRLLFIHADRGCIHKLRLPSVCRAAINLPARRITDQMVQRQCRDQTRFTVFLWDLQVCVTILTITVILYSPVNIPKDLILPIQQLKRLSVKVINRVKHLDKFDDFERTLLVMSHSHHACSGTAPSEILSFPPAVFSV